MNPQNQQPPKVNNPLSTMRENEANLFEVKRHPIGIIGTYISAGVLLVIAAVMVFVVGPMIFSTSDRSQIDTIGALAFAIFALLVLGFVFVANKVYWGNRWILTDDSITQVRQTSLFDKQSSQLSLGNLEDVTATQDGILAHMFNYGELRVETAGERSKFVFPYCPNPNEYARQVLEARENFEQGKIDGGNGANSERLYHAQGSFAPRQDQPTSTTATYQVPTDDDLQQ